MRNKDVYTFLEGMIESDFKHPRITYAINKNKRSAKNEIEDMEKGITPDKKYTAFTQEREEVNKKFCKKDDKGKPVFRKVPIGGGKVETQYDIEQANDPNSDYSKEIKALSEKHQDTINKHTEKIIKYNTEFLNDESEYVPFKVGLSVISEHEDCSQHIMDKIHWMIDEEN